MERTRFREKSFIWFDLGYTLIRLDRERTYSRLLSCLGAEADLRSLTSAFHYVDKYFMREYPGVLGRCPRTYMPWYLGLLNYRLGLSLDLHDVMDLWESPEYNPRGTWHCYPETHEVLGSLKSAGYRVGLISNWNESARGLLEDLEITGDLDCIVISSEAGFEKPDRRIFEKALGEARVSVDECLYIGDNYYDDVIGCRRIGMDILLMNRFGREGIEEVTGVRVIGDLKEIIGILGNREDGEG